MVEASRGTSYSPRLEPPDTAPGGAEGDEGGPAPHHAGIGQAIGDAEQAFVGRDVHHQRPRLQGGPRGEDEPDQEAGARQRDQARHYQTPQPDHTLVYPGAPGPSHREGGWASGVARRNPLIYWRTWGCHPSNFPMNTGSSRVSYD